MTTFQFYLDKKVITWVRELHTIEAESLQDAKNIMADSFNNDLCSQGTFVSEQRLYNDEDYVTPEDNGGEATLELRSGEDYVVIASNINNNKKNKTMTKKQLEDLLNRACELLIIFEDGGIANEDDKVKISAIFDEIKYSDKIDEEMSGLNADEEAQNYDIFGDDKI